jgi:UrcA family protein
MKNRIVVIAAALAALSPALAAPAVAADRSVTVSVGDLDLNSGKGRAMLDRRIETAARMACDTGARDAASLRLERECQASAIADASADAKVAIADAHQVRLATIAVNPGA